ncbi:Cell adhesion molecule 3 like protein [Argiope bruennichi]|uniref:Cell adhesion molecule 3 like protein n=1 Tax=Argiope bruennichi TaxID=94029 RepID=A0A8T0FP26_ARGBR|nr:Cell adhesion molecule 3 like protein [Argiope bruennichi]
MVFARGTLEAEDLRDRWRQTVFALLTVKWDTVILRQTREALWLIIFPIISIGLKITRFEVPSLVVPGDSAILTGFIPGKGEEEVEETLLGSGYTDHVEFSRSSASSPQYMAFPHQSLAIDQRASNHPFFEVLLSVVSGDSAILTCFYDLGKEKLYSVKWYKDHVEFFRFFPSLSPQYMAFPAPGLDIDLSKSSPNTVYLRNLTLQSEGQYTCQISADEPYFGCVQVHRDVVVYIPPESSPLIYGEVTEYGDNITVRCSSAKSKPAANLSWYVNDVLMDSASIRDTQEVIRHPDQLESSSSSISIPLTSHHLPPGDLRLTCAASIANVVTSVSEELLINRPLPEKVLELKNRSGHFRSDLAVTMIVIVGVFCI